jgi:hypothetical protein
LLKGQQFSLKEASISQVDGPDGQVRPFDGVLHGFADSKATGPVAFGPTQEFSQTIAGLLKWRNQENLGVDSQLV